MPRLNHEPNMGRLSLLEGYDRNVVTLSKERNIFVSEVITQETGSELSALLLYYDTINHNEPINVYLNTDGGDASGLVNIYDVMQLIKAPIRTICMGKCYSAGAVILAAGSKGLRTAFKSSKIMMHGLQCGFPLPGNDMSNSKNYFQFLEENNDNIMKILAKHTGHTLEKVKQDCLRDFWLDPKEAKGYGLIDTII